MSRLISFGCSFTVGLGLPDIYPPNKPDWRDLDPSQYAWPNLLGQKLNREVVNCGVAGSGNQEILSKILSFDFQPDDLCIVLWSAFVRHDMAMFEGDLHTPDRRSDKDFLRFADIDDPTWINTNRIRNWLTIHHAGLYLQHNNIQNKMMLGILDMPNDFPQPSITIPNMISDIYPSDWVIDQALDQDGPLRPHPGLESHRLLSQLLYDRIT